MTCVVAQVGIAGLAQRIAKLALRSCLLARQRVTYVRHM